LPYATISCLRRATLSNFLLNLNRSYASGALLRSASSSQSVTAAFDRKLKQRQRDNAARAHQIWHATEDLKDVQNYDYFRQEIATRLVDRLDDIKRPEGFSLALDLGAGAGWIHRAICADEAIDGGGGGIGGVKKLVQLDSSEAMLFRDQNLEFEGRELCDSYRMVADEENQLPFPDGTFDLVISSTSLHWVNDLPGLFSEVRRVLKPDGCFLFSMIGATTLPELRTSLALAELERDGGFSPRVGPFVELPDVGALLQRAGFALPTIDIDTFHISFPDAAVLMEHLQRMGESNACIKRRDRTPLDVFLATACIYDHFFRLDSQRAADVDNKEIEASVQVIYAIGWTPHKSQQQPLERGTATHRVGEIPVLEHVSGSGRSHPPSY